MPNIKRLGSARNSTRCLDISKRVALRRLSPKGSAVLDIPRLQPAPKGLKDSAQVSTLGTDHPERRALKKGRQIERTRRKEGSIVARLRSVRSNRCVAIGAR